MYRLVSCTASVPLAFGLPVVDWFLRWRDYRRALNELENLSESDLRDLRISEADLSGIAWDEAARRHALRRRLPLQTGSRGRTRPVSDALDRRAFNATENRRAGFVAEFRRFADTLSRLDASTGGIFFILLALGPSGIIAGAPGDIISIIGVLGMLAVFVTAVAGCWRDRNKPPPPTVSQ
jgi:uncharacterized protein YjiS (DUF1127 family)